nr:hypothetical protein [Micromonospora sp. DSM 115978]
MFQVPNSAAMDAAATGGGPSTVVLPSIVTGQPQTIVGYAADLAQQLAKLASLFQDVERARQELRKVWSTGSASDNALDKVVKSVEAFKKISDAVEKVVTHLQSSAQIVKLVQAAYQAVVRAVNPVVAALLSNPFTQGAARALASVTTSALKAFTTIARTALDAIGLVKLAAAIISLVTIAGEVRNLLSGSPSAGTTAPTTLPAGARPAQTLPATGPAQALPGAGAVQTLPAAGQTLPGAAAVQTLPGAGPVQTLPATGPVPAAPGAAPSCPPGRDPTSNVWIAVDPRSGLRAACPELP